MVATAFADLGFDVDMGPLFQTPRNAPARPLKTTLHAVGVSTLAAGPQNAGARHHCRAEEAGREIIVFVGGVIPRRTMTSCTKQA